MAKVKIVDVAREAGVSLGTVSNALNHPEKVRPETRKLIQETIARLGYTPNQSARMLAGGQARVIGLLIPCIDHGFCLQIMGGAQNEAHKHGYGLVVASYATDADLEARYLSYFKGTQLAGVLVHRQSDDPLSGATDGAAPVVSLDRAEGELSVVADCVAQGRLIAEHAISCGAEHICVIGRARMGRLSERLEGIRDALASRPDIALEVLDAGDWRESGDGYSLGSQLARRGANERPDFIIGISDVLASGAIAGVRAEGVEVPGEIRIAGCDGNPLAWTGPLALTTCSPAGYEMGRKGVQLLIEHLHSAQEPERIAVRPGAAALAALSAEPRVEVVRPFLLARASTLGEGANTSAARGTNSPRLPETNLGAYL